MSKKRHLAEKVIQELEEIASDEVLITTRLIKMSHEELASLVLKLLASYRLAARVANAAFRFWQICDGTGVGDRADASDQLGRCLADYAPNQFEQHQADVEAITDELQSLLDEIDPRYSSVGGDRCIAAVKRRLAEYQAIAAKRHTAAKEMDQTPFVPRTPVKEKK